MQFHPYAQLGEDVDFDQRLRMSRYTTLKCNRFCYTHASSGDDHGADRRPTKFATAVVTAAAEVFDPSKPIVSTGTYPLLKDNHAWSWQKATTVEQYFPDG